MDELEPGGIQYALARLYMQIFFGLLVFYSTLDGLFSFLFSFFASSETPKIQIRIEDVLSRVCFTNVCQPVSRSVTDVCIWVRTRGGDGGGVGRCRCRRLRIDPF